MPEKDFYQISLKLILKNNQDEVLILKSLDSGFCAGFYDLPGGRIDDNEFDVNFLEILKRELAEEIGDLKITISPKIVALGRAESLKLDKNGKRIRVLYIMFEGNYHEGDIVISGEHKDYKWVNLKNIKLEDYFVSGILEAIKMYLK